MKYEIFINGGFANIPKQYKGEIVLDLPKKERLLETLSQKPKPSREIHDGFIYHLKVMDGKKEIKCVFDEHNIPQSVRNFIDSILHKKE